MRCGRYRSPDLNRDRRADWTRGPAPRSAWRRADSADRREVSSAPFGLARTTSSCCAESAAINREILDGLTPLVDRPNARREIGHKVPA